MNARATAIAKKSARLAALTTVALGVVLSIATSAPMGPGLWADAEGPPLELGEPLATEELRLVVSANAALLTYETDPESFSVTLHVSGAQDSPEPAPTNDEEEEPNDEEAEPWDAAVDLPIFHVEIFDEETGESLGESVHVIEEGVSFGSLPVFMLGRCEPEVDCEVSFLLRVSAPSDLRTTLRIETAANAELRYAYGRNQEPLTTGSELAVSLELVEEAPQERLPPPAPEEDERPL
jgi:hypothetical protein